MALREHRADALVDVVGDIPHGHDDVDPSDAAFPVRHARREEAGPPHPQAVRDRASGPQADSCGAAREPSEPFGHRIHAGNVQREGVRFGTSAVRRVNNGCEPVHRLAGP
ncbi:hypothetical protein GCM10009761_14510 [Agromyces terreus]